MKTTWLQFSEYDEQDKCSITDFEVSTEWLKSQLEEPLEDFLDEYTSDEAIPLYELAILKGKVLNKNISK